MPNLNKVFLIGHLGDNPKITTFDNGQIANMSLATTESHKQGNEWVKTTTWHKVVARGQAADYAEKYLRKGNAIFVEGKIRNREYTDKAGVKKYITEVVATSVSGLGGKGGDNGGESATVQSAMDILGATPKDNGDIPF